MKSKLKSLVLALLFSTVFFANFADAAIVNCGRRTGDPCEIGDLLFLITKIVNFLLSFAGIVAIIFIFIGGVRMVLASANPDQVKDAKATIYNAILGLVLTVGAYLIINIVLQLMTGGGTDFKTMITDLWK